LQRDEGGVGEQDLGAAGIAALGEREFGGAEQPARRLVKGVGQGEGIGGVLGELVLDDTEDAHI